MEDRLFLPMEDTMMVVFTKETDQHIKKETYSSVSKYCEIAPFINYNMEDVMKEVCNKVILKLPMSVSMSLRRIPSKMIQTLKTKSLLPG